MSEKLLISIIAVFVLLFVAGIIYLFVISAEPNPDEAQDLDTRQEAATENREVISEIPGETGPKPVEDRGDQNDRSTESIRPEMVCGALEGRVLDMQDRPIANAMVSLYKNMPGTAPMIKRKAVDITAVTDDKGYYLLPAIPVDSGYLVFARADGFAGAEMSGMSVAPDRTIKVADFRLDLGFTILGTVTDNLDNPLGNVEVKAKDLMRELTGMTDADHTLDTLTGPDGRFTLACLSKNQYDITFTAMGFRSLTVSENFLLSRQGDEPREITVKLDPSGMRITGRVADPTGASIPKAVVKAIFSRSKDHAHFTAETLSDKKGNFLLAGFSEGSYILRASARGFFQQDHISAKGGEEGVLITLQPTGAVKGALRAASGKTPRKYTLAIETYTPTVRVVEQNQHSSQPCAPRSPHEVHQHRFGLIIQGVPRHDRLPGLGRGRDCGPSGIACPRLQGRAESHGRLDRGDVEFETQRDLARRLFECRGGVEVVPNEDAAGIASCRCHPGGHSGVGATSECHDERAFRQEVDNLGRELVGCQAIRCSHRSGSPISSSVGRASGLSHAWSSVVHEARASTPLMN